MLPGRELIPEVELLTSAIWAQKGLQIFGNNAEKLLLLFFFSSKF